MENNNNLENFMSLDEVAARLDVSKPTARNWCNKGLLSHLIVGNRVLVSKASFQAFSSHIMTFEQVQKNMSDAMEEMNSVKKELEEEKKILQQEISDRRWTNNHIQYFSEMFALMMHALYDTEDDSTTTKVVKYFLDGDDYKDISLLTGLPVQQVMGIIRRFGRSKLRTQTYASLSKKVEEQKQDIEQYKRMLETKVGLEDRMLILEKELETYRSKDKEQNEIVKEYTPEDRKILDTEVMACRFSTRLNNILHSNGISTVGEAYQLGRMRMMRMRNMGRKSLNELEDYLNSHNLTLPD